MMRVVQGDCVEVLARMPAASVDSIVCDPPYGLAFMGKEWDSPGDFFSRAPERSVAFDRIGGNHNPTDPQDAARTRGVQNQRQQAFHAAWAAEAFRVLKPGGYLLAFGGSRTVHRLACAIEDVGFEIRDSIVWVYGQGFPKSLNLDGEWKGWGTALKPGMEPIVVARKPLSERTVAANVVKHGTGALNIDGCRIEGGEGGERDGEASAARRYTDEGGTNFAATPGPRGGDARGRWPANVVLSHVPDDFDADGNEVLGCRCVGTREVKRDLRDATAAVNTSDGWGNMQGSRSLGTATEAQPVWECAPGCPVAALDAQTGAAGDEGGASRFFYQSKATNRERWGYCHDCSVVFNRGDKAARAEHKPHKVEYHPTVKPVDLMRWLVRLVTPPGGLVLDPFCGTGTTGEAASAEGFRFTGVEREPIYTAVATHRLITGGRIVRGAA